MKKKFKLLKDETPHDPTGVRFYRIVALRDFDDVKKGDKGGYVAMEENLSHEGNCWIYDEAHVWDHQTRICGNAKVRDRARICNHALICDNAKVYGDAYVNCSVVEENAEVFDNAWVISDAIVRGNAKVYDHANVIGDYAFK